MQRHSCCKKGLCSLERATGHWTSRQTASFSLPKDDWVKSAVAIDADLLTLLRCISCGGTFTTADAALAITNSGSSTSDALNVAKECQ